MQISSFNENVRNSVTPTILVTIQWYQMSTKKYQRRCLDGFPQPMH